MSLKLGFTSGKKRTLVYPGAHSRGEAPTDNYVDGVPLTHFLELTRIVYVVTEKFT